MSDITVAVKVIPFDVPDKVYLCCTVDGIMQKDHTGSISQRGSMPIRELSKETIDELVEQFRQGLYAKKEEKAPTTLVRRLQL